MKEIRATKTINCDVKPIHEKDGQLNINEEKQKYMKKGGDFFTFRNIYDGFINR